MRKEEKSEELLTSWLRLSAVLRNERMVKTLTFREVSICHILSKAGIGKGVTATEIVNLTGILKSQVNKVLGDMEAEGLIQKERCEGDKRKIFIFLTKKGRECYKKEHEGILTILDSVCQSLGDQKIKDLISDLDTVANTISKITSK